jgi:hypothetical protein
MQQRGSEIDTEQDAAAEGRLLGQRQAEPAGMARC